MFSTAGRHYFDRFATVYGSFKPNGLGGVTRAMMRQEWPSLEETKSERDSRVCEEKAAKAGAKRANAKKTDDWGLETSKSVNAGVEINGETAGGGVRGGYR